MLGYSHGAESYGGGSLHHSFGHGLGRILLGNLKCSGNEDSILECSYRGWGIEDCSDSGPGHEWAGISCKE